MSFAADELVDATPMERCLAQLMGDLSEDCWCAGWLDTCEKDIYDLIWGDKEQWAFATRASLAPELEVIKAIAELADAWIVWEAGRSVISLDEAHRRFGASR